MWYYSFSLQLILKYQVYFPEEQTTTAFPLEMVTEATTSYATTEKCNVAFPNKEDPDSCSSFYHCQEGPNGITWVKKDCGPGTFYNPKVQVCDFEENVKKLKPSCAGSSSKFKTPTVSPNTTQRLLQLQSAKEQKNVPQAQN